MKSWPDKLREIPLERLTAMIREIKADIKIKTRDLATMERIMAERVPNKAISKTEH
jgi:hypothetical protein